MFGPNGARRALSTRRAAVFVLGILFSGSSALAQAPGDPARGELKAKACESCHGARGRVPLDGMPSLAGQPEVFLTLQLILLREGLRDVPQMAAFTKGLSDQDVTDIAAHFARQTLSKSGAARNAELFARGAELAKAMNCGSCHLTDYSGQRQMPRLAGQREDYLLSSMKAFRDNRRAGTDTSMNGVLYLVPDSDIRALAHYLARQ
jgi:cytochrome c553